MHYLVMVVGDDALEQLEQFSEDVEVDEYEVDVVTERDQEDVLNYYSNSEVQYASFEECYKANGEDWNGNIWRKDDDGIWREYSRRNPEAHWDWCEIGGRLAGMIKVKEGVEFEEPQFSWGWCQEDKNKVLSERRTDAALIKDIENLDELYAHSIVIDGEWTDIYGEGSSQETPKLLKSLSPETRITFVDCHC